MTMWQDKVNRRYLCVLGGIVLVCVLAALGVGCWLGHSALSVLLTKEAQMASVLLASGVSETVVAAALANEEAAQPAAVMLLEKLGHSSDTAPWLFADVREQMLAVGGGVLLAAFFFGMAVMVAALWFLRHQERRYLAVAEIIGNYAQGHFEKHLPNNECGTLSQMFAAVEELALSLKAKSDNEQQVKEFLKTMVTDISHQVKTPLAALRMYNDIVAAEPDNASAVRTFTAKSAQALDKLEQLIQSLLKVTRLDAGSVWFDVQPQRAKVLVEQAVAPLVTRAEREGKQLSLEGAADAVLLCDVGWTSEAVANLVKNALDHTQAGAQVRLSWTQDPAFFRISVADDGEGIAADDIHHIFKRFYRSAHTNADSQGVGLGLPIAKAIVEGQGGVLSVVSAPGEGTTFTMAFPKAASAAAD